MQLQRNCVHHHRRLNNRPLKSASSPLLTGGRPLHCVPHQRSWIPRGRDLRAVQEPVYQTAFETARREFEMNLDLSAQERYSRYQTRSYVWRMSDKEFLREWRKEEAIGDRPYWPSLYWLAEWNRRFLVRACSETDYLLLKPAEFSQSENLVRAV